MRIAAGPLRAVRPLAASRVHPALVALRPRMATSSSQAPAPTTPWFSAATLSGLHERAKAVLDYWLSPGYATGSEDWVPPPENIKKWFGGGPQVDQEVTEMFKADVEAAVEGKYDEWLNHPLNALAGAILMDQFTRNIYRGTAQAFAADGKAIGWSQHMVAEGLCDQLQPATRQFVFLPYMHQEDLHIQQECVRLFTDLQAKAQASGLEGAANHLGMYPGYAARHRDVVAAWGRFPHRNEILGREHTPEEKAGLAAGTIDKF